jgi:hypothetical protein
LAIIFKNMAININKVYRVVLAILNKEQRGYLTPDQFNRLGRQAQLDLFEKSFYDYNRALIKENRIGSSSEYGDIAGNIQEKIDVFAKSATLTFTTGIAAEPNDLYRTILLTVNGDTEVEPVKKTELAYLNSSKLTAPSASYPVYYSEGDNVKIFPTTITSANIDYIKIPADPIWGYTSSGGAYTYASGSSTDFELHPSEESLLVTKILAYAGVVLKDPTVIQVAAQEEANKFTKENS